jgi:hypothetical protein
MNILVDYKDKRTVVNIDPNSTIGFLQHIVEKTYNIFSRRQLLNLSLNGCCLNLSPDHTLSQYNIEQNSVINLYLALPVLSIGTAIESANVNEFELIKPNHVFVFTMIEGIVFNPHVESNVTSCHLTNIFNKVNNITNCPLANLVTILVDNIYVPVNTIYNSVTRQVISTPCYPLKLGNKGLVILSGSNFIFDNTSNNNMLIYHSPDNTKFYYEYMTDFYIENELTIDI